MKIAEAKSKHLAQNRQVSISNFVDTGYHTVFRPKFNIDKMVNLITDICNNQKVGYSQADRYSLYIELKKVNWDVSKLKECNCDCSSLIALVLIYGGYNVPFYMTTATAKDDCVKAGLERMEFSESKCKKGDILLKSGHIVMVVEENAPLKFPCYMQVKTKDLNGHLNVRETPNGEIIGSLNNLSNVYVIDKIDKWYIIEYRGNKAYASADYIV